MSKKLLVPVLVSETDGVEVVAVAVAVGKSRPERCIRRSPRMFYQKR